MRGGKESQRDQLALAHHNYRAQKFPNIMSESCIPGDLN